MNRRLHRLYSKTERLKRWFSSRFTTLGKSFFFLLGIGLFFGINVQRTMIYQIFTLSVSVLLLSYLLTLRYSSGLRLRRSLPLTCIAGREFRYTVEVENRGGRKEKGLFFRESVRLHLPDWHEFATSREDGEEKRNIFDRKMGYYRWLWLVNKGKSVDLADHLLPEVAPDQKKRITASLLPRRRGYLHLDGVILRRLDPFGLCRRDVHLGEAFSLLVLPKIYKVPRLFPAGSRKYHRGGMTAAHDRGDSNEFVSLREYTPGDPVKYIDWKSTARIGKTIVKQYLDEYFPGYGLVLDNFTREGYSGIFEEAVSLAASIVLPQDGADQALDYLFVENECITCSSGRDPGNHQRILEILATAAPCTDKSFADLAFLVRSRATQLSGVIVILIDFDDERRELIRYLHSHAIPTKAVLLVNHLKTFEENQGNIPLDVPLKIIEAAYVEEQIALI